MRVLFGHQSVGGNLLQGIAEHCPATKVIESRGSDLPANGSFIAHFRVGQNHDPVAKIRDFVTAIDALPPGAIEVALFKLCYVDITPDTDVDALYRSYDASLAELNARHPRMTFAHLTVPLRALRYGLRGTIKRALGREHPEIRRNAAREQFNHRVRARYQHEQLFDLARLEAGFTNGTPNRPLSMLSQYTDDGGHLNAAGRAALAPAFHDFLQQVSRAV